MKFSKFNPDKDLKRPLMLASVTSPAEAKVCLSAGADIIDAKDPAQGALGGLPVDTITEIVAVARASGAPVSATIGDLACDPASVTNAVRAVAAAGVDYVKVGFQPFGDALTVVGELGRLKIGQARIVGVLFADLEPDFRLIEPMAASGFAGVLVDTAEKAAGSLTSHLGRGQLAEFIARARAQGLFTGLAGSLRIEDIDTLASLGPHILGFRGALCLDSRRTFAIDETSVQLVRARIDARSDENTRVAS